MAAKVILTHPQFYALCEAVRAEASRLHEQRPAYEDAARQLGGHLGFAVSEQAVRRAARAVNLAWKPVVRRRAGGGSRLDALRQEVELLRRELAAAAERLRYAGEAVHHLYARLGEPLPAGWPAFVDFGGGPLEGRPS